MDSCSVSGEKEWSAGGSKHLGKTLYPFRFGHSHRLPLYSWFAAPNKSPFQPRTGTLVLASRIYPMLRGYLGVTMPSRSSPRVKAEERRTWDKFCHYRGQRWFSDIDVGRQNPSRSSVLGFRDSLDVKGAHSSVLWGIQAACRLEQELPLQRE